MDFGIAFASSTESWRVAQRAEDLGFTHAWFYDTQLLNPDVFVCMALAAQATKRIRLGTGVLIPSNRLSPVAANGYATLSKLAPGRIDFGVGTGFTGRRTMGQGAIKLADFERYIHEVQALLRGETVTMPLQIELFYQEFRALAQVSAFSMAAVLAAAVGRHRAVLVGVVVPLVPAAVLVAPPPLAAVLIRRACSKHIGVSTCSYSLKRQLLEPQSTDNLW